MPWSGLGTRGAMGTRLGTGQALERSETESEMILQPDTRPISHKQHVMEVEGVHAGLVIIEAKCIDIDEKRIECRLGKGPIQKDRHKERSVAVTYCTSRFLQKHPRILIILHSILLRVQHRVDYSQILHVSSDVAAAQGSRLPRSLATQASAVTGTHARLYLHCIIMIALLYDILSILEDTWIEYLGDLGTYRMAIEDD